MSERKRWKVLVTAPRAVASLERYERELSAARCEVIAVNVVEKLTEGDLIPLVGDVHAIVCGDDEITSRVLDAAPRLRVISKWGTGIDSIDGAEARRRGIAVCNSPGAFSEPVADTVMGYILLFARRLDAMSHDMKAGLWRRTELRALGECTLGIVGLGNSGRAVAKRAMAFGMRVVAHTLHEPENTAPEGVDLVSLTALLRDSDFVTLHADLRPESRGLIDETRLRSMKPSAVLINTARGALVDERALETALRHGWIGGAALDVFTDEPLPASSALRSFANVYLAPHNANGSSWAAERVHANSIAHVLEVLRTPPAAGDK